MSEPGLPEQAGGWPQRLPRWTRNALGGGAVVAGMVLATRPLTALQVLPVVLGVGSVVIGVAALASRDRSIGWHRAVGAAGLVTLGIVLVLLRTRFDLLAVVIAVVLLLSGIERLLSAATGAAGHRRRRTPSPGGASVRPSTTDRVACGVFGAVEMTLGVVAFAWPDLTLLAAAVTAAVRSILIGVRLIRRRGAARLLGAVLSRRRPRTAAVVAMVVVALGASIFTIVARTAGPIVDDFYATPAQLPDEPGHLLRHEPFTRDVPEGATGWRILYTTTAADGSPATASALVVVPDIDAPVPVIAWAHGTTGFDTRCAPSLADHPFDAGAMPALDRVIDNGWAVVATDYTGLGTPGAHPYLIGTGEAYPVLDSIRAAHQLTEAELAPGTVVWGHSQGGHAALWTGQVAQDYAPELDLRGVVAMAPAADVVALAETLPDVGLGEVFASFVIAAYADHYPEITLDAQVIAAARPLIREMSQRCLAEPSIAASAISALGVARDRSIYSHPPAEGALGERLATNVPTGPFSTPLLVAQGEADDLIDPDDQQTYVDGLCTAGHSLDYRTYPGEDHLSLVDSESALIDDLLAWTSDRLDGTPAAGCR